MGRRRNGSPSRFQSCGKRGELRLRSCHSNLLPVACHHRASRENRPADGELLMNCATHEAVQSEAFCTQCGRGLCSQCVRKIRDSVYCENCLEASLKSEGKSGGPAAQTIGGDNPDTAFVLGLIPGVGAIYNGEYFKAAIH